MKPNILARTLYKFNRTSLIASLNPRFAVSTMRVLKVKQNAEEILTVDPSPSLSATARAKAGSARFCSFTSDQSFPVVQSLADYGVKGSSERSNGPIMHAVTNAAGITVVNKHAKEPILSTQKSLEFYLTQYQAGRISYFVLQKHVALFAAYPSGDLQGVRMGILVRRMSNAGCEKEAKTLRMLIIKKAVNLEPAPRSPSPRLNTSSPRLRSFSPTSNVSSSSVRGSSSRPSTSSPAVLASSSIPPVTLGLLPRGIQKSTIKHEVSASLENIVETSRDNFNKVPVSNKKLQFNENVRVCRFTSDILNVDQYCYVSLNLGQTASERLIEKLDRFKRLFDMLKKTLHSGSYSESEIKEIKKIISKLNSHANSIQISCQLIRSISFENNTSVSEVYSSMKIIPTLNSIIEDLNDVECNNVAVLIEKIRIEIEVEIEKERYTRRL